MEKDSWIVEGKGRYCKPLDAPSAQISSIRSTGQYKKNSDKFIAEIQQNILKALSAKGMSVYTNVLWEELNKVLESLGMKQINNNLELMSEMLVTALTEGGSECRVITEALSGSVFRCFDSDEDPEKYEKSYADHKTIIRGVEQILGYLVLSLVNLQDSRNMLSWLGDNDLSTLYFELHVRTRGGVELFISYQQHRKADLEYDPVDKEITGKYLILVYTTPFQWSDKARLQDTQLTVWNKFYDEERTHPLNTDDIAKLAADLDTARRRYRDPANYCIVIEFEDNGNASYVEQCSAFLSELKIPMIRYKVDGGKAAFNGMEQNLMSAVKQFLIDFNKCRYL